MDNEDCPYGEDCPDCGKQTKPAVKSALFRFLVTMVICGAMVDIAYNLHHITTYMDCGIQP